MHSYANPKFLKASRYRASTYELEKREKCTP